MNKNTILGITLIVLLGIYFLVERNSSSSSVREKLIEVSKDAITKLSFTKAGKTIDLINESGSWKVDNYAADQAAVTTALESVSDIKLSRFVTDNNARFSGFELDSALALFVTVSEGEKETKFVVGKQATSYRSIFVRMADSSDIYSTKTNFKSNLDKTIFDWKNKSILAIPKAEITSIEVLKNSKPAFILQNQDSLNMIFGADSEKEPAKKGKTVTNSMLSAFSSLNTTAFPSDNGFDFSKAELTLKITQAGNLVTQINCVAKDDNAYFLQLVGNETVFQVNKNTLSNFEKSYADLVE